VLVSSTSLFPRVSVLVELEMLENTFQLVSFSICFDLLSVNTFKSFF